MGSSVYKDGFFKELKPRNKGKPPPKTKPPPAYGPIWTKAQAAEYLCVSERTLERWVKTKRIRKVKGTSRALFPQSELDRFIANSL